MTREEQKIQFDTLVEQMKTILLSKGHDYAFDEDVLSNFKVVGNICGIKPELACLVLVATKVARLGVLLSNDKIPNNESIKDSMIDLNNYGVLLSMIHSEESN